MQNWSTKKLGEIISFEKGKKMSVSENKSIESEPYIGIENLRTNTYLLYTQDKNGVHCKPDDVLLVWDGAYAGTVGIGLRGFVGSTIVKVLHNNSLNNRFLVYLLNYNQVKIRSAAQGAAVPHLNKRFINNLKVPLPAIEIQQRIAERMDAIKKAQGLNDKQIALADELFQSLLERELSLKNKNRKIKNLGDLVNVKGGKRVPKGKRLLESKTSHPYIRVIDFKDFSVDTRDIKYIDQKTHEIIENYTVEGNDIYVSIAGTTGVVGLIPEELSGANLTENAVKLILKDENVDRKFLTFFLSSNFGQNQLKRNTYAPGVPKLAIYRLENTKIPLPPLENQRQIVAKLQAAQDYKKKLSEQKQKLQELFESCLDKAMKGELVS